MYGFIASDIRLYIKYYRTCKKSYFLTFVTYISLLRKHDDYTRYTYISAKSTHWEKDPRSLIVQRENQRASGKTQDCAGPLLKY